MPRGNVVETWLGTDDTGATDAEPTGGGAEGNNMLLVSTSTFDADGHLVPSNDAVDRTTSYTYDWRGRLVQTTQPDPDGEGPQTSPVIKFACLCPCQLDSCVVLSDCVEVGGGSGWRLLGSLAVARSKSAAVGLAA